MKLKTLTAFTAAAMLAAGISVASAQNTAGRAPAETSPSNLNTGSALGSHPQSGSETTGAAQSGMMSKSSKKMRKSAYSIKGKRRFCSKTASGNALNCNYASMAACEKVAKPGGKVCVNNPRMGTTGMGVKSKTGMTAKK